MLQGSVAGKVFFFFLIIDRRERTVKGIWNSRTVVHMNMASRLDLAMRGGRRERRDEGVGKGDQREVQEGKTKEKNQETA